MAESYRYYAFISYSSKDAALAKGLQDIIESYRLPVVIRNELEAQSGMKYPKKLSPLFRDMTDLAPAPLGQSIRRELEDSKYMIVLCSPNSAESQWVNQEIENFILMGRYDHILLYITEGEPNSTAPSNEAFPPILRKNRKYLSYADLSDEKNRERQGQLREILKHGGEELKGVHVLQEGESPARGRFCWYKILPSFEREGEYVSRMKLIARMLEIKPDDLIQRDKQRQRRQIRFFAVLLAAMMLTGVFLWDKYYRLHVDYYADYTERWGAPYGIPELKLTKNQVQNRATSWRIKTRSGIPQELACVDSSNALCPIQNSEYSSRYPLVEYDFSTGYPDRFPAMKSYDESKRLIIRMVNVPYTPSACSVIFLCVFCGTV